MALLSRANLLKKEVLEIVKVDLGGGDFVYVTQMTGHERDRFEQSMLKEVKDKDGKVVSYDRALGDFRAKLAVVTMCDEKGNMLLQPEDYLMLSKSMSAKKLEMVVNVAQKLNSISEEDKEALIKNSEAAPDGNSNSASV